MLNKVANYTFVNFHSRFQRVAHVIIVLREVKHSGLMIKRNEVSFFNEKAVPLFEILEATILSLLGGLTLNRTG